MVATYLWFKALHLIFMVAWFAGLFYIFRLFAYHVKNWDDPRQAKTFSLMERRLLYIIMYPAMVLTLVFGFLMIAMAPAILAERWFQIKLAAVLGLMAYHFYATVIQGKMLDGEQPLTEKTSRIINEVPTVLLIIIIIMVVIRPGSL